MKSSFFNIYLRLEEGKGGYNKKKQKGEERMLDRKRMRTAMLIVMAFCLLCITSVVAGDREKKIDILFTHDVHSHLDCFKVKKNGEKTKTVGGFARMKTLIDEKRKEDPELLLLDGGDFSMGTLYQTINRTEAAELTMMGRLGYDAVTFGNHEFDYRSSGLSEMLISAVKNKEEDASLTLPMLLSADIDWEKNKDQEDQKLREAMELYGAKPYTILERNGVKIGIYGVLGQEAEDFAPESGIDFDPIVDTSKKIVKELKDQGAEMIICLSHSGTNEDSSKSEDEELARKVPDIDVIISGHTHTKLKDYIKEGDTYIVSCGNYGEALGELRLKKSGDRWKAEKYQLNALTDDGILVNIDGNANRVSFIAQGPQKVVFIVGMNKVASDLDHAMKRARNIAAPINAGRFDITTPCTKTGKCMDCKSIDTVCCQFLITRFSRHKDRIHVILVNENLGF